MKTISFKVTDEEARNIRRRAMAERLSLSEFLRRKAAGVESCDEIIKTRCEFTDAEIFGPLKDGLPLTSESVKKMLANFP